MCHQSIMANKSSPKHSQLPNHGVVSHLYALELARLLEIVEALSCSLSLFRARVVRSLLLVRLLPPASKAHVPGVRDLPADYPSNLLSPSLA